MTLSELQILVDYHYWARDRLLDALDALPPEQFAKDVGNSFSSIHDTVAHLYGADVVWCARWDAEAVPTLPDVASFPSSLAEIRSLWRVQEAKVRAILARLGEAGVAAPMSYRGLDGRAQAQPFWHQLQHLVNHGSYHRGQVTTMLRQFGASPAKSLDLIAFYRERAAASV